MPTPSFYAKTAQMIEDSGHSIIWVSRSNEPFMYTIGNDILGLPEFILFGPQSLGHLMNEICQIQRERGSPFDHGEVVMIETKYGHFPIMIAETYQDRVRDEYTVQAGQYLKHETYHVQQILPSDMNRKLPHEAGYEGYPQTLLNAAPLPLRA